MAPAIEGARARARAELTREIKAAARRQLAAEGAQGLSLRAVARELGMASSALYRYFPSRDDLLTALIVDAYNALGDAAEQALGQAGPGARERWHALCGGVRSWARAHPHEYALLYGSPVPGYAAPEETVAPASRVALLLIGLLREHAGDLAPVAVPRAPRGRLALQAAELSAVTDAGLPSGLMTRAVIAWTQLFGMVSFELFGQLVGSMDPADDFFRYAVDEMADLLGLPEG